MTMTANIFSSKRRIAAFVFAVGLSVFSITVPASVLSDLAATMKPGEWKEVPQGSSFGGGSIFTPAGGAGNIIEYMVEAQRNPFTKKIYLIGCSKGIAAQSYQCGTTTAPDAKFVVYDEVTNSWAEMPSAPVNVFPHSYDQAAMDPSNGDYYYREEHSNAIWRYSGGEWTKLPQAPAPGPGENTAEFFPELGGLVVPNPYINGGEIYLYSVASNSWSIIPDDFIGSYTQFTEYNPIHKFLYFGGGYDDGSGGNDPAHKLYKLDANKKVTRLADAPVDISIGGCTAVQTLDPITGKLVLFSCSDKSTYEYNPSSNSWSKTGTHALVDSIGRLRAAAVPLFDYGVTFVVDHLGSGTAKVYLYKHSTGSPPPPDNTPPAAPANPKVK